MSPGERIATLLFTPAVFALPQSPATGALIVGPIESLTVDNINDRFSAGKMVVSGQLIILPRNLVIDLPANRATLQELFVNAPPLALAAGKSGLAILDGTSYVCGFATVHANRTSFGNAIAGEVFIDKGLDTLNGIVTFINHTDGYVRVDGIIGDDTTGTIVRPNDPDGVHTIQQGKGCGGGPNCSPDTRFTNDSLNYTLKFVTGYPMGIPSTVPAGQRAGFQPGDNPAAASNASGVGDIFCPSTNRTPIGVPVPDSRRFAPVQVGDSVTAEGNYEFIAGVRFLSAHTFTVARGLTTQNSPTQPDYVVFDEAEWDATPFAKQRQRCLLIGFSTLPDSQLDVFSLQIGTNGVEHEVLLASTVNNPGAINQGIGATAGGIWKFLFDVDFAAQMKAGRSPCESLINAGLPNPCTSLLGTVAENMLILNPISRDIIAHTRHQAALLPGVITRDILGNQAQNGQYLNPVGVGYPEFGEINLDALQTPFSFDGIPWSSDRRVGPGGDGGNARAPLDPFPWSGVDPLALVPDSAVRNRIFGFFPFGAANLQVWPPTAPGAVAIGPVPSPGPPGGNVPAPVANFTANSAGGTAPAVVSFTDTSTGTVNARLWDFGDGQFSILQNPVHTFTGVGTFTVSLTALGLGGVNTNTKVGLVTVTAPGGPGVPVANFTQNRTAGNVPLTVNFTSTSTGTVTSFLWSFGDGGTSTLANPSHVYTTGGVFTVSLTATGPGGSNVLTKLNLITANVPGAYDTDFVAQSPTTGTAPLQVRFRAINVVGTAISGTFDFGDGSTASVAQGNGRATHTYAAPGVYTVTLTATDGVSTDIEQKVNFVTVTAAFTADGVPFSDKR